MILRPILKSSENKVFIVAPESVKEQVVVIKHRCAFYIPELSVEILKIDLKQNLPIKTAFGSEPLLVLGDVKLKPIWVNRCRGGIFNVDYLRNPGDGWQWHKLMNYVSQQGKEYLKESKYRLVRYVGLIQKEQLDKCYIFGTGPSLMKAIDRDWSDGYRIVCNTIVRDPELWNHIDPHFIVAGDGIYHFGYTSFAKAFRKDLAERLSESRTMFIYPSLFHSLVIREFRHLADRLIAIPQLNHEKINVNLTQEFALPRLGNVLPLLLLPVACTLSRNVYMLGFDGRAPNDKLFWSNSSKHYYPEFIEELQNAHPSFFENYVPKDDPQSYAREYQGEILDEKMIEAESEGWKFLMLHKSWTPTLQKRCVPELN